MIFPVAVLIFFEQSNDIIQKTKIFPQINTGTNTLQISLSSRKLEELPSFISPKTKCMVRELHASSTTAAWDFQPSRLSTFQYEVMKD